MREIEQKMVDALRFAEVFPQNGRLVIEIPNQKEMPEMRFCVAVGFTNGEDARQFCLNLQNSKAI
jgi:hypothetical protein